MKLKDALKHQRKSFELRMAIRHKKALDYSSEDECLGNFKRVAELCKIFRVDPTKSYGIAFIYRLLKMDREANLIFGDKEPQNESILDSILDDKNYIDLFEECLIDDGVITTE